VSGGFVASAAAGALLAIAAHHAAAAASQAKPGSAAAQAILAWLAAKADPRWANRGHQPLMFGRLQQAAEPQADAPHPAAGDPPQDGRPSYSWGHAGQRAAWSATSLEEATTRARQASADGEPYVVTEGA